jgi:UDP-N-acetylmuramyl pentapeptide synthase
MKQYFKSFVISVLTFEAKLLLRRTKPTIIAITGSVGKTSTKDAIYTAIKDSVHARKSQKSYNSEIGVPLSVLGLENGWNDPLLWLKNLVDGGVRAVFTKSYPDVLVLEMGVDRPGDMQKLMSWITPDVVVLTRLPDVPVHVEYFANPEAVIAEKMHLVNGLKPDGILIFNNDDERVVKEAEQVLQKTVGYSRYSQSDFTVSGDEVRFHDHRPTGFSCTMTHHEKEYTLEVNGSLGVQHAYSYAAALAVAEELGVSLERAVQALNDSVPPPGRMRILRGIENTLILDDTYNSSPVAARRALQSLEELHSYGQRKVAVLGDMLELGKYSTEEHEKIGAFAAEVIDMLVTVGVRSRKTAEGALEHGLSEKCIFQYDTIEDAMVEVPQLLQEGDAILIKGSQGVRAEKLVYTLMEEKEKAAEYLVRQDTMWEVR